METDGVSILASSYYFALSPDFIDLHNWLPLNFSTNEAYQSGD